MLADYELEYERDEESIRKGDHSSNSRQRVDLKETVMPVRFSDVSDRTNRVLEETTSPFIDEG